MQFFDPNNPNEKKKMIAAGVLAVAAIAVLGYVFFGGSSSKPPVNQTTGTKPSPSPRVAVVQGPKEVTPPTDDSIYQEIKYSGNTPGLSEGDRNIFAFYEPPPPTPKPTAVYIPTPTPTPPLVVSSISPPSVFAGTPADFSLQVAGDKFTPAVHVVLDGIILPTRFINGQQLFATVSQSLIRNAGARQVMARSNDGTLYSNTITLNVNQAPQPNFTYIGIIGKPRYNDTAVLQDKSSKDFIRVQRGDPVGGRWRVVSISEKEVLLIDATLKIPYHLAFTADQSSPGAPYRPPVRTVDDEPLR
jgi:hypothetical protein